MEGIEVVDLNNQPDNEEKTGQDGGNNGDSGENNTPEASEAPIDKTPDPIPEIAEEVAKEEKSKKKPNKKKDDVADKKDDNKNTDTDEKVPRATGELKKKVQCPDCKKIISKWNMLYKHPGICTKTPIEYPETLKEVTEEDKKPQVAKKPSLIEQSTGFSSSRPPPQIHDVAEMMRLLPPEDQQRLTLDMYQRTKLEQKQRKANIYKNLIKF